MYMYYVLVLSDLWALYPSHFLLSSSYYFTLFGHYLKKFKVVTLLQARNSTLPSLPLPLYSSLPPSLSPSTPFSLPSSPPLLHKVHKTTDIKQLLQYVRFSLVDVYNHNWQIALHDTITKDTLLSYQLWELNKNIYNSNYYLGKPCYKYWYTHKSYTLVILLYMYLLLLYTTSVHVYRLVTFCNAQSTTVKSTITLLVRQ